MDLLHRIHDNSLPNQPPRMLFAAALNRTLLRNLDLLDIFDGVLIFEIVTLLISYFLCFFCCYVLYATAQMHPNFSWVIYHLASQYCVQMTVRIASIFVQWQHEDTDALYEDPIFVAVLLIRTTGAYLTMTTSASFVVERLFATVLIDDYEQKERPWIRFSLIAAQYALAIAFTSAHIFGAIGALGIIIVLHTTNIVAFLIYLSIYRTNVLHEKQRVNPFYQPELSKRYQLWENLRTLEISPLFLNVFYELFDLSFAFYGFVLPILIVHSDPVWRRAAKKMLSTNKIAAYCIGAPEEVNVRAGEAKKPEAQIYFDQLKSQWGYNAA